MNSQVIAIWRKNLGVWIALILLLSLTFGLAHVRLGAFNTAASLIISTIKTLFVLLIFMGLRRSRGLMALAGGAGVFWLCILFALTFSDVLTR